MTVSAIEFSRLGPPKLRLYAMRCSNGHLSPWWEHHHCYQCGSDTLHEEELAGGGELTNYTVVHYPPRDFLGQEPGEARGPGVPGGELDREALVRT